MTLRQWLYEQVSLVLLGTINQESIMSPGSAGLPIPGESPNRPFATLRIDITGPGLLPHWPVNQDRFAIWVHDEPGSMVAIDRAIKILERDLPPLAPAVMGEDEGKIMEVRWESSSADLYDDHYKTSVRYADFVITYRETM